MREEREAHETFSLFMFFVVVSQRLAIFILLIQASLQIENDIICVLFRYEREQINFKIVNKFMKKIYKKRSFYRKKPNPKMDLKWAKEV
jgi:hypothetical protein